MAYAVPVEAQPRQGGGVREFSLRLPGDDAARAAGAGDRLTTRTFRAPERFDVIGFRWRGGARLHGEVRVHRPGEGWSPWVELGEHGPEGVSDPVWAGRADRFQVRHAAAAHALEARFITVPRYGLEPVASAAANQPTIIPRAAWDPNNEAPPKGRPSYGRVEAALVHHTVNANEYTREESPAIVLGIAKYHRNSNGWQDIGYNFLVDRFGQIFEGRAGGIDRAVVGAQAEGYNGVTTGVSNIGTFDAVGQTPEALRAIGQLIAWKLSLHGVPTTGQVVLSPSRTTERIASHRDVNPTSCPGNALYAQLPEIRRIASSQAGPVSGPAVPASGSLTAVAATTQVAFGDSVTLTGRLSVANLAPGGHEIEIQKRGTSGGYRTVGRVRTGDDGSWSAAVATNRGTSLRARFAGAGGQRALASAGVRVAVLARLTARARAARITAGSTVVVSGQVSPSKKRLQAIVSRKGPGGYRQVATVTIPGRGGGYAGKLRLPAAGLYRLTVVSPQDARTGKAEAAPVFVRATRPSRRSRRKR